MPDRYDLPEGDLRIALTAAALSLGTIMVIAAAGLGLGGRAALTALGLPVVIGLVQWRNAKAWVADGHLHVDNALGSHRVAVNRIEEVGWSRIAGTGLGLAFVSTLDGSRLSIHSTLGVSRSSDQLLAVMRMVLQSAQRA